MQELYDWDPPRECLSFYSFLIQYSASNTNFLAKNRAAKSGFSENIYIVVWNSVVMGNCMESCTQGKGEAGEMMQKQQQEEEIERSRGFVKENSIGKNGLRVKIVLTKEELNWLIHQLKDKTGTGLEEALGEIERSRGKVKGWKPSLESILEIPEKPEMDR